MMKFTRRKFLRFAPASVGVFALGGNVVFHETTSITGLDHLEGETVDVFPGSVSYIDPPHFVVTDGNESGLLDHYFFPGDTGYDELNHMINERRKT